MTQRTSGEAMMDAPLEKVWAAILDVENYPKWAKQFRDARVLERLADGAPLVAQLNMDAGMLKDTLTLRYSYDSSPQRACVGWHLEKARQIKRLDGAYILRPDGEKTRVTYEMDVDPGIPLFAGLRRKAEAAVIDAALGDLKRAVER